MLLSELLFAEASPFSDIEIQKVTSRVDEITNECCFVFIRGVLRDKSYLIYEIIRRRPRVIVAECELETDIPLIKVANARETLSHMLYRFYFSKFPPPPIIGITGTNGKSSTLRILYHLFRQKYRVGIIGTQCIEIDGVSLVDNSYTMTTPDPELLYCMLSKMRDTGCEYIIMEVSSHALALGKVSPLTFALSVFTGLGCDHLDFHKSKEEYVKAKEKIFAQSVFALLNIDDPTGQEYSKRIKIPFATFGKNGVDAKISNIKSDFLHCTIFTYQNRSEETELSIPLLGEHNAYNASCALYAYEYFGGMLSDGVRRLGNIPQILGRLEVVSKEPTVILDYAHTPEAMENVLSYIRQHMKADAKLIVLFGAGGDRQREKRPQMARIAEKYADKIVVSTDNPRHEKQSQIFSDIRLGFREKKHRFITERTRAVRYAYSLCRACDILVLLGKGHEEYILKNNQKYPYCELYALFLAKQGGFIYEN